MSLPDPDDDSELVNPALQAVSADLRRKVTYLPDAHRLLPQSQDAEKGVLGSFLLSPKLVGEMCHEQQITDDHFFTQSHSEIFKALMVLWESKKPIDFITLTTYLTSGRRIEQCGGAAFVTELFTFLPTAANAAHYLETLREKYLLRKLILVCTELAARGYDEQDQVTGLLGEAETEILSINKAVEAKQSGQRPIGRIVVEAIDAIERMKTQNGEPTGLPTGLNEIDNLIDGLQVKDMIVIAARPSMGKTALAMNIAEHVALELGHAVGIASLEMSDVSLVQRMIFSRARVNHKLVRSGSVDESGWRRVHAAAHAIHGSPIHILEKSAINFPYLAAVFRRWKNEYDIKLGVIDYLQLILGSKHRKEQNRQADVAEISVGVKALAKELGIPILVLAQLNRNPEARTGNQRGRPRLSDLRESGSIEQDADIVGLLVRDEVYAENDEEKEEQDGKADLIIAKARNGPLGTANLTFLKEFTRFADRAQEIKK